MYRQKSGAKKLTGAPSTMLLPEETKGSGYCSVCTAAVVHCTAVRPAVERAPGYVAAFLPVSSSPLVSQAPQSPSQHSPQH